MHVPKISVIVTNYNYGQYLYECVNSIRAQSFKDFELIIVDDASIDGSQALVQHLVDKSILFNKNQGTRKASNAGVCLSDSELCVFVNADDTIHPDFLKTTIEAFTDDPKLAFVYTDFWHTGKSDGKDVNNGVVFGEWDLENLKKFNYILCSAVFKRSVFLELGGFQVDYGMEDYDLWLRMGLAGYHGKHVSGYLYTYRAHTLNRTHKVNVPLAMEQIRLKNGIQSVDKPKIMFSICYATRRSWCMESVLSDWLTRAVSPEMVEVIVAVDADDSLSITTATQAKPPGGNIRVAVQQSSPFNSVKAWNLAAEKSTGKILIMISDDFVPPQSWDQQLLGLSSTWPDEDAVVQVNDCNNSTQNKPFTLPILTRVRYNKLGYVFWHEYESLFSDTEFGDHARLDGVVIDARTLLFEHVHHTCLKRSKDAIDDIHASQERWDSGELVYKRRLSNGFKPECIKSTVDLWKEYVTSVRQQVFAISLEAATWLEDYLQFRYPHLKTAVDVGANFESVIFAKVGLETMVADMELSTLAQTSSFLKSNGLANSYTLLDDLTLKYDVVFINAAPAESQDRNTFIRILAPSLVSDRGVIICNDGHFPNVRKAVNGLVEDGWTASVPKSTMDSYDRFLILLTR